MQQQQGGRVPFTFYAHTDLSPSNNSSNSTTEFSCLPGNLLPPSDVFTSSPEHFASPPLNTYPHNLDPVPPFHLHTTPPNTYPHLQPALDPPYPYYNGEGGCTTDATLTQGIYAYGGSGPEPYGARGMGPAEPSDSAFLFDDYGRATSSTTLEYEVYGSGGGSMGSVAKAAPKVDDANDGVQKFRAKLLPEGSDQGAFDVLCLVGLDGIRMLDPSTNKTLRIYRLENLMKCEVMGSTIFVFWAKSSVDFEPRRVRLELKSYMTNIILDTVTTAMFQFKEMGGKDSVNWSRTTDSEQQAEQKKGLIEWMNLIKPTNEDKDHWVPDEEASQCISCGINFGAFMRKHHCRNCGLIFCNKCTSGRIALTADEQAQPVRVCDGCMAEVSQKLCNTKEDCRNTGIYKHEDLAKKLQVEMEKNCTASKGQESFCGSNGQMREVACPVCTVHLQVRLPFSGCEKIECGVCQHPFLVSAPGI